MLGGLTRALLILILALGGATACGDSGPEAPPSPDAATILPPVPVWGPDGRIDFAYHLALADEDPTGETRTYSIASGDLPAGLTLAADGTVSGTPTAWGVHELVVWGEGACPDITCRLTIHLTIEVLPVILLSGYGPFAGVPDNPSWAGVAPLDEALIGGYDVRTLELTVTWDDAWATYALEYERLRPAMAIGSGVAMGDVAIRLESLAINFASGEDVDGIIKNEPIEPEAGELDTGLPLADLRTVLEDAGYPVVISDNAGTYLCNYLFYKIMHRVEQEPVDARVLGGFVHVTGEDVVSIPDLTHAWELMLGYLTTYRDALQRKTRRPGDRPWVATEHHPPRYLYSRAAR